MDKTYLCIDLKSFYASVECVERGLNPMTTNLVVADPERSDKTICLAVSPSMKALGVKNRCRVFEIPPGIDYIMAAPRMQKYIDYAADIYGVYLNYISPDDIYVYSIDEAFIDVTPYLQLYGRNGKEMAVMLMEKVWEEVGVRATAGVGTMQPMKPYTTHGLASGRAQSRPILPRALSSAFSRTAQVLMRMTSASRSSEVRV